MWVDWDKAAVVFVFVSPLPEGNLKLSYMDWLSLTPKKFENYVRALSCPVHRS